MEQAFEVIQETPVPTLLILVGLFFILLGFVTKIGGLIEVSQTQKKLAIPVGLLVLTVGLVIHLTPTPSITSELPGTEGTSDLNVIAEPSSPTIADDNKPEISEIQQDQLNLDELHNAVSHWDLETSKRTLNSLKESNSACIAEFARLFEIELNDKFTEGFRNINSIKRRLNTQYDYCDLEIIPYGFSP